MGKPASISKSAGTTLGPILACPLLLTLLCLGMAIWAERVPFTTALLQKAAVLIDSFALFLRVMLELTILSFVALSHHPHLAVFLLLVVVLIILVVLGVLVVTGPRITL